MTAEKGESARYLYGAVTNPFFSGDAEDTDEQLPVDPRMAASEPSLASRVTTVAQDNTSPILVSDVPVESSARGYVTWARTAFQTLGVGSPGRLGTEGSFQSFYPSDSDQGSLRGAQQLSRPPQASAGEPSKKPKVASGGILKQSSYQAPPQTAQDSVEDDEEDEGNDNDSLAGTMPEPARPGATGRVPRRVAMPPGATGKPSRFSSAASGAGGRSGRSADSEASTDEDSYSDEPLSPPGRTSGAGMRSRVGMSPRAGAGSRPGSSPRAGGGLKRVGSPRTREGLNTGESSKVGGTSRARFQDIDGSGRVAQIHSEEASLGLSGSSYSDQGTSELYSTAKTGNSRVDELLATKNMGATGFFNNKSFRFEATADSSNTMSRKSQDGNDIMRATMARMGATQAKLTAANVNMGATGFHAATLYPTAGRDKSARRTMKDIAMGKESEPEDPAKPLGTLKREHKAIPYIEQDMEAGITSPEPRSPQSLLGYNLKRINRLNVVGCLLMLFYIGSLAYYLYVRVIKMDIGYFNWYSGAMLFVEILGASTVILYGLNLIRDPLYDDFEEDIRQPGTPKVKLPYAIRVLIVCYKEDLECIQMTIEAAASAPIPYGCSRTIYLCDDGKDKEKEAWVRSKGFGYVYVSGRTRAKGEMNGKSGNLNNVFCQIYPPDLEIPGNEVMCIFDADQMAQPTFFLKTVPLLDGGDDIGMVLTPQAFHNLDIETDIFNHSNVHFWEYMQPGADTIGFISCTGTNFLVRANAFRKVGMSPMYTMTEDYALGMELKKETFQCRYVREYLALGEAPHEVRNCFQQRSRWTKGHFQIFFQTAVCPLFQFKLSAFMKLMYCTGIWSYVVCAICTPFFLMVPVLTVWIGVFPLAISRTLALAATLHFKCLFYAGICNQILWWAFVKAAWRAFVTQVFKGCSAGIVFKATAKGKGKMQASPMKDIAVHIVTFSLLFLTIACAVWQMIDGATITSPLLISIAWAVNGIIPPALMLYYALIGTGLGFLIVCRVCMFLTTASVVLAIVVLWLINDYKVQFSAGTIGLFYKLANGRPLVAGEENIG